MLSHLESHGGAVVLLCWGLQYSSPVSAAAAKSLQSCPTLCDPLDGSPPGSSVHGIFQARTLEWAAISFSMQESESEVAQSCPTLSDPMDCGPPGSSVHGILQARALEWGATAFPVSCMSCLYVLEISPLSVVSFAIIFSHSEGCLFTLLSLCNYIRKLLL